MTDATDDDEEEEEGEEAEPDDGPGEPDLYERADMLWFKLLDDFTNPKFPPLGAVCEAGQDNAYATISPLVKEAQDLAIVAAFRAMERLMATIAPDQPPLLDFSRLGRG